KTKPGEKSFSAGTTVAPFFRDRSDYEFVRSLIEAYSREKLIIEKGTLMTICKGAKSLVEIKIRVDDKIAGGKQKGIKEEIYTRLQHYLENLIPQIQYANFSSVLNITDGINIMDLERFSGEAQSLIIRSVADEVLKTCKDTIIVIPEAWKFIPQRFNNPCKQAVESYIRQGATNNNFIWIDSQDMSGVDKTPLKQISTWILGYQAERNEVKHTLDQISLPKKQKPPEDEIMNLSIGQFILSSREQVVRVYVQPAWLPDEQAWKISTGKMEVREAILSKPLPSLSIPASTPKTNELSNGFATKKEVSELRMDFFTKMNGVIEEVKSYLGNFQPTGIAAINEDDLVLKVLQKMPAQKATPALQESNTDLIVEQVLKRIPKTGGGSAVYQVAPLEKIKKDFLRAAKDKIISDTQELSERQRTLLKFVESQEQGCSITFLLEKCLFLVATSGTNRKMLSNECSKIVGLFLLRRDKNSVVYPNLKGRIAELMGANGATNEEIQITYDHILASLVD
ncbi:MAG TPA: hypothetical protein VFV08_08065, partial [Puia sp.]|nr:hypothetical protein [Puia sp.]